MPRQTYCPLPACQRERRRLWQLAKRASDPDYLANQTLAQQAWSRRNQNYWRAYREAHEQYVRDNRAQQLARNRRRAGIAKMDPWPSFFPAGTYALYPHRPGELVAKMDPWIVRLEVLSSPTAPIP